MSKMKFLFIFSLSVSLFFLTNSLSLKADACDDCETEYKQCLDRCLPVGCTGSCNITRDICEGKNCSPIYALHNWSTFGLNFFNSKNELIGTLPSPGGPLLVQESDFPITAAWYKACPTLESDKRCTTDDTYRVVIPKGCHVVWYAVHFYLTDLKCEAKTSKGSLGRSQKRNSATAPHQKAVVPSTSTSSPKRKEVPSQERHPR